ASAPMRLIIDIDMLVKATKLHEKRKHRVNMQLIIIGFLLVSPSLLLLMQGKSMAASIMLALGVLLAVQLRWLQRWRVRQAIEKQFRQAADKEKDVLRIDVTFNAETICFTSEESPQEVAWSAFTGWQEEEGLLLLYRNRRLFHVLPLAQMTETDRL